MEKRTCQGGSGSPLLANVYLHYVFDMWVQAGRGNRALGYVFQAEDGIRVGTVTGVQTCALPILNISALFISRPVMTTLVMLGILSFGLMAYRLLPVSNLPNVDFPTIQVNASLPGASPERSESVV